MLASYAYVPLAETLLGYRGEDFALLQRTLLIIRIQGRIKVNFNTSRKLPGARNQGLRNVLHVVRVLPDILI